MTVPHIQRVAREHFHKHSVTVVVRPAVNAL